MTSDITEMLQEWTDGNSDAADRLFPFVYKELRKIAGRNFYREGADSTLQPTALVNEAYVRLVDQTRVNWQNRAHFFAVASTIMRRILIDHARRKSAGKRGGGVITLSVDDLQVPVERRAAALVSLDEALEELAVSDYRKFRVVEMKFFGGMSEDEISEILGISTRTVQREWSVARLWLFDHLNPG